MSNAWKVVYGSALTRAGSGGSQTEAGPGARSDRPRTSLRHERYASRPDTRCSSTNGASVSNTAPVAHSRRPGCCRCNSATRPAARKADGSSRSPHRPGASSSAAADPGPQASTRIVPSAAGARRSVAAPALVRVALHQARPSTRQVGSCGPRRSGDSVCARSMALPGRSEVVRSGRTDVRSPRSTARASAGVPES